MKDFFQRNPMLVAGVAVASVILALVLGLLLLGARELQLETLKRIDKPPAGEEKLLGPQGMVSDRSKRQLEVVLRETPHVLGGWIVKLNYGKTENPIIHHWSRSPVIEEIIKKYGEMQTSGKGYSSAELNRDSQQSVRNSEEAKTGIIKCGPLSETNLPKLAPAILQQASAVCRATIPPFDDNVNLAVVVVVDIQAKDNTPEVQDVRRSLLRLQIDIFNRDYQGRETWARQLGER